MKAPPVHEQPRFDLYDWIIVKSYGRYHLVGHPRDGGRIRSTTPIVTIDSEGKTCRTQSGRHYQLMTPCAHDLDAQLLLVHYQRYADEDAVDATDSVLDNPMIVFDAFHAIDKNTGEPIPVVLRLQRMAVDPASWLPALSETLAQCDLDPALHYKLLGLSEQDWRQWRQGQLKQVPLDTALRGWIITELLEIVFDIHRSSLRMVRWMHSTTPGLCGNRITKEVLLEGDLGSYITLHRFWATIKSVLAQSDSSLLGDA